MLFLFPIGFDVLLEEVEDLKLDTPDAGEVTRIACPFYNAFYFFCRC